jgi:nicotinamide mononucleotide adenylyltransferase
MEDNFYVFPGRFQPFHYGHKKNLDEFFKRFKFYPTIAIYESRRINFYNPFNVEEVKEIINSYFPEQKLDFITLSNLVETFKIIKNSVVVVGDSRKRHLYKIFGKGVVELVSKRTTSATKIKNMLLEGNEEEVRKYVNDFTFRKLKEKEELLKNKNNENYLNRILYGLGNRLGKIHLYL